MRSYTIPYTCIPWQKQIWFTILCFSWYVSFRPLLTVRWIMCIFTRILVLNLGTESIAVSLKYLIWIVLSFLTLGTVVCKHEICTNPVTEKPLDGYYCPVDTNTVQLSRIPHHLCTHYCVSVLQCPMFSYHETKDLCTVHKDICVEMLQGTGQVFSSVVLYEPRKHECISWMPYQGSIPDGERLVHMGTYYVLRLQYNNEILPGKLKRSNNLVKTVSLVNGITRIQRVADSNMELIVVSAACSIARVPYVAGNQMPPGAVVGGQKANGEPLFVASLWTTDTDMVSKYAYGWYDPISFLGYSSHGGQPRSNSSVDIMVEIWVTDHIYHVLIEEQYSQSQRQVVDVKPQQK